MNQIFDWMRKQINAEIKECQDFYLAQNNDSVCKCVMQGNVNAYAKSLSLIDEAEYKWEADCCEWHRIESSEFDYMDSKHGFLEEYTTGWNFCPYCGKPIKIVEVE